VPGARLASRWEWTDQRLAEVVKAGKLFCFPVDDEAAYVEVPGGIAPEVVAAICRISRVLSPGQQPVFWTWHHSGLAGRTALDALAAGRLPWVLELASARVDECPPDRQEPSAIL
jgi:hypothetical protein